MQNKIIGLEGNNWNAECIRNAKWAYTTRRIDKSRAQRLVKNGPPPQRGDLVIAKVTKIRQHKRIVTLSPSPMAIGTPPISMKPLFRIC